MDVPKPTDSGSSCASWFPPDCLPLLLSQHTSTHIKQVEEFELPSPRTVCFFVLVSYFFVTAGVAYDIINEPPAIGAQQDPVTGRQCVCGRGSRQTGVSVSQGPARWAAGECAAAQPTTAPAVAPFTPPCLAPGKVKPEAFMAYRMNGQYILEGISGAMMYTLGGAWRCSCGGQHARL